MATVTYAVYDSDGEHVSNVFASPSEIRQAPVDVAFEDAPVVGGQNQLVDLLSVLLRDGFSYEEVDSSDVDEDVAEDPEVEEDVDPEE